MFESYSEICLEHIKNKHIITRWMIGKHGYQNWSYYEGSSKTFIRHNYIANMIVLLSKTVSRFEAQFLRFKGLLFFLFVFSSKCKTIILNQCGNLVAITDSIQAN